MSDGGQSPILCVVEELSASFSELKFAEIKFDGDFSNAFSSSSARSSAAFFFAASSITTVEFVDVDAKLSSDERLGC